MKDVPCLDEETGIEIPTTDNGPQTTVIFDLSGRKVISPKPSQSRSQLNKGIYIVNGKKVVIE